MTQTYRVSAILGLGIIVLTALTVLTGCQSVQVHGFGQPAAASETQGWIRDAADDAHSSHTRFLSGATLVCESDHAYIPTTSDWRNVSSLTIPAGSAGRALAAIESHFVRAGWAARSLDGVLELDAPASARYPGILRISASSSTALNVNATSGCWG